MSFRPKYYLLQALFTMAFLAIAIPSQAQFVPNAAPSYTLWNADQGSGCDYLFVGGFRYVLPSPRRATEMILDRNGNLLWFHRGGDFTLDFKVHPNGLLSYSDRSQWRILDSTFTLIDSITCSGRFTDHHELQITPDGHYWLICRDDSTMDLSSLRTRNGSTGSTQGQVRMGTVQELDANHLLLKEWNGWNLYNIYDSDTTYFTNPGLLDLTHSNAIDIGDDGQVLLSHRHLNEVTLIDWATGEPLWRLGGKNNQFDLQGDQGYYGQHDARLLPNGRISLYDNGQYHHPGRGLVIEIDTLLWQARMLAKYSDTLFSNSMGSMQLLPDGSALINHGELTTNYGPEVKLFAPDSSLRMRLDYAPGYMTYRARCLDLPFQLLQPEVLCIQDSSQVELQVLGTHAAYEWNTGEISASIVLTDTGSYQVFVPQGIGMIGSMPLHITDLENACIQVGAAQPGTAIPRPKRLLGTYNLLGQPVHPAPGMLFLEYYEDGTVRKRWSPH